MDSKLQRTIETILRPMVVSSCTVMTRPGFIAIALLLCASAVSAQETARSAPPYVRASGVSTIQAKADRATITIGVVTQAPTAAAAASQNAAQVTAVIERLKKEIGDKGELRTVGYSVNPNYSYPTQPNSGGPRIVGYNASNTVEAKLDDISLTGRVIDAATANGANQVNGIHFSLKDEQSARAQALKEAALNARAAADALASALGLKVVRVRSAETGEPETIRPVQEMAMMRMSADSRAPTPVEPGNVQIRASVTVTLEVAQ